MKSTATISRTYSAFALQYPFDMECYYHPQEDVFAGILYQHTLFDKETIIPYDVFYYACQVHTV